MRRRKLTDAEKQVSLFTNETKPVWPVVHPEAAPKIEPLFSSTSDETGGPLNAAEAGRIMTRQSIRFAGHRFERRGLLHCRDCSRWNTNEPRHPQGEGFRRSIYCGTSHDELLGRCNVCGVDIVGEDPTKH